MRQTRAMQWVVIAALALALLTLSVPVVGAQSGGAYTLTWNTHNGGGGASSGGAYTLVGTIGQPDAGALSGVNYTLVGGFWYGLQSSLQQDAVRVFMPFIKR
jgi:hypothetical protein